MTNIKLASGFAVFYIAILFIVFKLAYPEVPVDSVATVLSLIGLGMSCCTVYTINKVKKGREAANEKEKD